MDAASSNRWISFTWPEATGYVRDPPIKTGRGQIPSDQLARRQPEEVARQKHNCKWRRSLDTESDTRDALLYKHRY